MQPLINKLHLGDSLCVALLIGLCLFLGLPRFTSNLDLSDEGLLAQGATRVLQGQVPHRDFVSLHGPLSFYTAATVLKLFGTSLLSLRVCGLCLSVLITLLVYSLARCFVGPSLSFAGAISETVLGINFVNFVPYAAWQGITANLLACLLILAATGPRWLSWTNLLGFGAGIFTAFSLLLRQDQGFYLIISILIYFAALVHAKRKSLGAPASPPASSPVFADEDAGGPGSVRFFWLLGIALALLPFCIYWLAIGALPEVFKQLVLFPFTTYSKTSSHPFHSFSAAPSLSHKVFALFHYFPPIIEVTAALAIARRAARPNFSARDARIAFLVAWSALFYGQMLARSDYHHLIITLPPFFVLCACLWRELLKLLPDVRYRQLSSVLAGACLFGFLFIVKPIFLEPPLPAGDTLLLSRARVRVLGAQNLAKLVQRLQTYAPSDRSILCLPYQPMFYFLCERRNPTRWDYLWPGDQTAEDHEALIRRAKADPPALVLITDEERMQPYASDILDYVHANYKPAATFGERPALFTLYLPRN